MKSDHFTFSLINIGLCLALTASAIWAAASGLPRLFSAAGALALLLLVLVLSIYPFDIWSRGLRRDVLPEWLVVVLCCMALAGIIATNWPMELSYRWSRSQLEEIARQARDGMRFKTPLRVGLFTIEDIEVRERGRFGENLRTAESGAADLTNIVCLWLSRRHETLLAQCAPSRPMFNVFTISALDDRWVFVTED